MICQIFDLIAPERSSMPIHCLADRREIASNSTCIEEILRLILWQCVLMASIMANYTIIGVV
jgi:hypothetical protein